MRDDYRFTYITTATTTSVYVGRCRLIRIVLNTTAAGTIGIRDGNSGTQVNAGLIKASAPEGTYHYGIAFREGIRIITGAASDLTVVWTAN